MNKYLIIDKNTISREAISSIVYSIDEDSLVYEAETINQISHTNQYYKSISFVIINAGTEQRNIRDDIGSINKIIPNVKFLLIIDTDTHEQVDSILIDGVNAIVPVNSDKNELVTAIRALKGNQAYYSQNILKKRPGLSDDNNHPKDSSISTGSLKAINEKLTTRQKQVLDYLIKGYANKLIAYELGVSEGTVKLHVSSILRALKVTNRTEAAMRAGQLLDSHAH